MPALKTSTSLSTNPASAPMIPASQRRRRRRNRDPSLRRVRHRSCRDSGADEGRPLADRCNSSAGREGRDAADNSVSTSLSSLRATGALGDGQPKTASYHPRASAPDRASGAVVSPRTRLARPSRARSHPPGSSCAHQPSGLACRLRCCRVFSFARCVSSDAICPLSLSTVALFDRTGTV